MKKFLAIFIISLTFITFSKADNVKDFQIEGMSIGDSLLDYVTPDYIKANSHQWYNDEYFQIIIDTQKKKYEEVVVSYKSKDKKYLIASVSGSINYGQNILKCYEEQNEIDKIFSKIFQYTERRIDVFEKGSYGTGTGDTNSKQIVYELSTGTAVIDCLDWDQKSKPNFRDRILISIDNREFRNWLIEQSQSR